MKAKKIYMYLHSCYLQVDKKNLIKTFLYIFILYTFFSCELGQVLEKINYVSSDSNIIKKNLKLWA